MAASLTELSRLLFDNRHLAPELLLVAFALILLGASFCTKSRRALGWLALAPVLASLLLVSGMMGLIDLSAVGLGLLSGPVSATIAGGALSVDLFSLTFKLVFLFAALLVLTSSLSFVTDEDRHVGEYYSLLLLATTGMMVVASAESLISLFVGIELASISTYALAAFRKREGRGAEAAVKYFIIGASSSAILLYGLSLLYGTSGTLEIAHLSRRVGEAAWDSATIVGLAMVTAGLGFKMAAVPFHMWAPDVYEGSPTTVTAFLAAGAKKMAFAAAFKLFLVGLVAAKADYAFALGLLSVLTMTVGNVVALSQTSLKRMLAYSSIAQAGYILTAVAVGSQTALAGGVLHALTHAFMKGGAFIAVAAAVHIGVSERVDDYRGLGKRSPLIALSLALLLLSLAGIPPLAGFWSKFVLFSGAVEAGGWFVWLALAGVLNSALSLYYYALVIKRMYVDGAREGAGPLPRLTGPYAAALLIATAAVVIIGVCPAPFVDAAMGAAGALLP